MARYGGFKYNSGTKYGRGGLGTTDQAFYDALAGQSPAVPARAVPWRRACSEIWSFNPTTWAPVAKLPYVESGAVRTATRVGVGFEQQTLTFRVSNAAYYLTGGAGAGLLDRGAYLVVRWTVETPLGTASFNAGVFQADSAPSPSGADEGSTLSVTAVDWAQPLLAPVRGNGWVGYAPLLGYRDAYITAGGQVVDYHDSWGTLLAGFLWTLANQRVRVDSWPQTGAVPPDPATLPPGTSGVVALQVGDAGKALSAYDTLAWFWPGVAGFKVGYDNDGYLRLMDGKRPRDSGFYATTGSTALGSLPLPWERPLAPARSKPQFTRVQYFYAGAKGSTPTGAGSVPGQPSDPTLFRGEARSWSRVHPHAGGDLYDIQVIVEADQIKEPSGFANFNEFCRYRLADYLGSADTLTLHVDGAMPPGPTGRRVRVYAPADDVTAQYELTGYTQPLDVGSAQWQLRWLEEA